MLAFFAFEYSMPIFCSLPLFIFILPFERNLKLRMAGGNFANFLSRYRFSKCLLMKWSYRKYDCAISFFEIVLTRNINAAATDSLSGFLRNRCELMWANIWHRSYEERFYSRKMRKTIVMLWKVLVVELTFNLHHRRAHFDFFAIVFRRVHKDRIIRLQTRQCLVISLQACGFC